ncbi:MAG TPA: calcium-binding protein [Actinomycetota bacterium]|nr:calcium-binding protein [Actinomycetota bacterium]
MRRAVSILSTVGLIAVMTVAASGPASASRLVSSFDTGLPRLVAIAVDGQSNSLLVYEEFGETILEYSKAGAVVGDILRPGAASNDFDLDVAETGFTLGSGSVPAGGVLVANGDVSPPTLFGIDQVGNVTGEVALTGTLVGASHHAARGSVFAVDWSADMIREIDPAGTGTLISEFPVAPSGSPLFDVYYGDVAVSALTGNLFVVSSNQSAVRELTPTGAFVQDYDLTALGITGMSGIDIDPETGDAWIVTIDSGQVYRVVLEPVTQGTDGDDTLTGTEQNDVIEAGAGDDTIEGGGGDDTISGGDGNDSIAGDTSTRFRRSDVSATAEAGDDTIDGGAGNDLIDAGLGADSVVGGTGSDRIWGMGSDDRLGGGGGGDQIKAGAGADVLSGGGGADTLVGGPGADRFNAGPGKDLCIVDSRREKRQAKGCEKITLRRGHARRG